MKNYLINFIEEVVIPATKEYSGEFPETYDLANVLVIEDVISILEEQLETNRLLNIRHMLGGFIIDMKTYIDGAELVISIFYDKKTLSIDTLYEGEYLEILNLNKPEFQNEENDSFYVIDNLVQKIVSGLW